MKRLYLVGGPMGVGKTAVCQELKLLQSDRDTRLRSYRILGLCAGAALVILLI